MSLRFLLVSHFTTARLYVFLVTLDELAGVSSDTLESGERLSLAQKQQKAKECLQKQLSLRYILSVVFVY